MPSAILADIVYTSLDYSVSMCSLLECFDFRALNYYCNHCFSIIIVTQLHHRVIPPSTSCNYYTGKLLNLYNIVLVNIFY